MQWNRCACVLDALEKVVSDGIAAVGPGATRVPRACIARLSTKLGEVVTTKSGAISTPKHPGVWGTIHGVVLKYVAHAIEIYPRLIHPFPQTEVVKLISLDDCTSGAQCSTIP